mgnify:CR=1 FL=1
MYNINLLSGFFGVVGLVLLVIEKEKDIWKKEIERAKKNGE